MENKDFTITIQVDAAPADVFDAVCNVRGWWSENIEGATGVPGSEFAYHYKDVHSCRIRVTELIPGEKVLWKVLQNKFSFIANEQEWQGDEMIFDISRTGSQTVLTFTQRGLTPADECYQVCEDAWTGFIGNSLLALISDGRGEPAPKDGDGAFNEALIEKWDLNPDEKTGFSYRFRSPQSPASIFAQLLNVRGWWSGQFGEAFEGRSDAPGASFSFNAGDGAHYSKQELTSMEPDKHLSWLVTDSRLRFLKQPDEWTGTRFSFDLEAQEDGQVMVTFRHTGLVPAIECYPACSSAWTLYMDRLAESLQ